MATIDLAHKIPLAASAPLDTSMHLAIPNDVLGKIIDLIYFNQKIPSSIHLVSTTFNELAKLSLKRVIKHLKLQTKKLKTNNNEKNSETNKLKESLQIYINKTMSVIPTPKEQAIWANFYTISTLVKDSDKIVNEEPRKVLINNSAISENLSSYLRIQSQKQQLKKNLEKLSAIYEQGLLLYRLSLPLDEF